MSADNGHASYVELIGPGELGDQSIDFRLTARELAAMEFVLQVGISHGALDLAAGGAEVRGVLEHFSIAFRRSQTRIGAALSRVLAPDNDEWRDAFASVLAGLDQEQAELDQGEGA